VSGIEVRAGRPEDAAYVRRSLVDLMGGARVAGHGELIDAAVLPTLIAWIADEPVGHLTHRPDRRGGWEVATLGASRPGQGVAAR
jgi:hypothetical protein